MDAVEPLAPDCDGAVEYDRQHLALYASLLEAADAGLDWRIAATELMRLDLADCNAEACWCSHLERARWIVGDGLPAALKTFGTRTDIPH